MPLDHLSLATTPIFLLKGQDLVSQGTGFYYARQNGQGQVLFLVTNYHVLTGEAPSANAAPIGDSIAFQFHESAAETGKVRTVQMPLFTKHGRPIWITNANVPEADLALIPLPSSLYDGCAVNCISEEWASGNIRMRPTSSVTLIGYPYGYYDKQNALPIWKTGSIASEPEIDFDGKPLFVIDISAFPGTSGSPAFAISYGAYETEDGPTTVGGIRKFLGIYASMQMLQQEKYLEEFIHVSKLGILTQESLELGQVWKAKLIIQTVNSIDIATYESEILRNLG